MNKAPVLFVLHGAPKFALEPGILGPHLNALGKQLSGVEAVFVVSAHWQTRDVSVMITIAPEAMHDFGGSPPAHPQRFVDRVLYLGNDGRKITEIP